MEEEAGQNPSPLGFLSTDGDGCLCCRVTDLMPFVNNVLLSRNFQQGRLGLLSLARVGAS